MHVRRLIFKLENLRNLMSTDKIIGHVKKVARTCERRRYRGSGGGSPAQLRNGGASSQKV